jgi:hypothetical protein
MHALKVFPPGSTLTCAVRLLSMSMFVMLYNVCNMKIYNYKKKDTKLPVEKIHIANTEKKSMSVEIIYKDQLYHILQHRINHSF